MNIQPVEINVAGLTLRGNFYQADKPKDLAILFLHGWTGLPNEPAAKMLAQNGFSAMTFSLSGHNNSDGKLEDQTRQKSLQEVLAAYDLFKSKLPADTKIVVAGNSYGGYMAAVLSVERPLAAIHIRVPANYFDETFNKPQEGQGHEDPKVFEWRHQKLDFNASRSLKALHNFDGPVQIIEAELDDLVPHQTVQNYVDAVKDKSKLDYHFMKGWTHSLGLDPERNRQYQELLLNWLQQQV
jgi:esterase/lipase